MRIAVIYNEPMVVPASEHWLAGDDGAELTLPLDYADASELGVLDEVEFITDELRAGGHECVLLAAHDVAGVASFLDAERPDLIFNACESLRGDDSLVMAVAGVFDLFAIPYTGSPALTLGLALDKSIAKAIFLANGIPTPAYAVLRQDSPIVDLNLRYPLIVKPVQADASNGISAASVVTDADQLARRVRFVWQNFDQPALVEEYIDGRELNVALLATSATEWATLPISEIRFEGFGSQPRIVSYESKWMPGTAAYEGTNARCPARLSTRLAERVREVAVRAAHVIGLRDYGRVDMRVRGADVFVLEANPNPDISRDAGFMRAAVASGRTHADTIREIVARAAERSRLIVAQ